MSRHASPPPRRNTPSVLRAFDEAAFGPSRTLNLRSSLPTAAEATARTESWLRERQVSLGGTVLVITGRGKSSEGGVSVLKPAVEHLLFSLRRRGVVTEWREHNEGSLVVSLAPVSALFSAPKRKQEAVVQRAAPGSLAGLSPRIVELLHDVAVRSLNHLGITAPGRGFIEDEMVRTFANISRALPPANDREQTLEAALRRALAELEE